MTMNKDDALKNFVVMISQSWTFMRMTEEEKQKCMDLFLNSVHAEKAITGNYKQRFETMHAIYNAYLIGIGYDGSDCDWRGPFKKAQTA